jgi:hypothetical protein
MIIRPFPATMFFSLCFGWVSLGGIQIFRPRMAVFPFPPTSDSRRVTPGYPTRSLTAQPVSSLSLPSLVPEKLLFLIRYALVALRLLSTTEKTTFLFHSILQDRLETNTGHSGFIVLTNFVQTFCNLEKFLRSVEKRPERYRLGLLTTFLSR